MKAARVNGASLEYEDAGAGESVLLIGPGPIADAMVPLRSQPALSRHYRLITYRQRGQAGARSENPVTMAEHASDAAALLASLGVRRAHVVGHSTGAIIALQLAFDHPELVHSVALMEPPLLFVSAAGSFLARLAPAAEAFQAGNHEAAMAHFLALASGLEWGTCRTLLEQRIPGSVAMAIRDAGTFFAGYLPALQAWQFGPSEASSIFKPMLSVLGTQTEPLFAEGHRLLHQWFPELEDRVIEGAGHLLQLQRPAPVAEALAAFFSRNPLAVAAEQAQPSA